MFVNLGHGQTVSSPRHCSAAALHWLDRNGRWLAGILFGLLAYKPQFGVVIPFALLAGGTLAHDRRCRQPPLSRSIAVSFVLARRDVWHAFAAFD